MVGKSYSLSAVNSQYCKLRGYIYQRELAERDASDCSGERVTHVPAHPPEQFRLPAACAGVSYFRTEPLALACRWFLAGTLETRSQADGQSERSNPRVKARFFPL